MIDMDRLSDIYLMANTPAYLFKHFRRESSLQSFAQNASTATLSDYLRSLADRQQLELDEVVRAYAYLIALSLKEPDGITCLESLPRLPLDWQGEITALAKSVFRPTLVMEVRGHLLPSIASPALSLAAPTQSLLIPGPKPKISRRGSK
jgi:hypothetical protein